MSQRNASQKNKRLMLQPPMLSNSEENQPPGPANDVPNSSPPHSSPNSDSERTLSASPNNVPSPPTSNSSPIERPTIHPIDMEAFDVCKTHRDIIECITKIFPDAIKSYKDAPKHMKDIWFNEFRKLYKWNPEDEATIQSIFHKRAARRLSDTLGRVRIRLAKGEAQPKWMSDPVLAQYLSIWNKEDFKKTAEKNKRNINSDCGGLGPSLHTAGSIPMTEHKRRLKEKLGEEPSHAALFQATHKSKKTLDYVCIRAKHVMDTVSQIQQTQPELGDTNAWYEAAGGLKKRGCVFGFGSATQHYFPEVARQRSKFGQSSSHVGCDEKMKELKEENKQMLEKLQLFESQLAALRGANPQCFQTIDPNLQNTGSQESSGLGLDDLRFNDDIQSPMQAE